MSKGWSHVYHSIYEVQIQGSFGAARLAPSWSIVENRRISVSCCDGRGIINLGWSCGAFDRSLMLYSSMWLSDVRTKSFFIGKKTHVAEPVTTEQTCIFLIAQFSLLNNKGTRDTYLAILMPAPYTQRPVRLNLIDVAHVSVESSKAISEGGDSRWPKLVIARISTSASGYRAHGWVTWRGALARGCSSSVEIVRK